MIPTSNVIARVLLRCQKSCATMYPRQGFAPRRNKGSTVLRKLQSSSRECCSIHLKSHRLHCHRSCDRLILLYRKFGLFSSIFLGLHRCRRHSRGCRLFHWLLQTKNPAGIISLRSLKPPTGFLANPYISRRRPLRQTPKIFLNCLHCTKS